MPTATYIVFHNPYRPNNAGRKENPAQEIVTSIHDPIGDEKLVTTKFGGWDITRNKDVIKQGDCLLFYRSGKKPTGFFAVGRVLPGEHGKCRKLREEAIWDWYGEPADLSEPEPGSPVYSGLRWDTGKVGQRSCHINAVWEVVGDPARGQILVPCNINELLGRDGQKRNGEWLPDEKAGKIRKQCANSPIAVHAK